MRKKTPSKEELLGPEFWERHKGSQRLLAERIAYHRSRATEEQRKRERSGGE